MVRIKKATDMKRELSTEEKMVLTGHFPYLAQALTMACRKTVVWRKTNDGTPVNFLNIFYFIKKCQ